MCVYNFLELSGTFEQEDMTMTKPAPQEIAPAGIESPPMEGPAVKIRGGGKLNRSETVTVRLDPKLRYLAELAARKQRRTLSSFIEWAVEDSLNRVTLYKGTGYNNDEDISVADEQRLWDADEAERFARLAILYPELLTYEEQKLWKVLWDSHLLSNAVHQYEHQLSWIWKVLQNETFPLLRQHWEELKKASSSGDAACRAWAEAMREHIEKQKPKPSAENPWDSDIPF
jgi:hypothetical protein